jgi:hypothetical protein
MCGCERHHEPGAECSCWCFHPGDSIAVRARKVVRRRIGNPSYEIAKRREKALMWLAWKCPREVAYWIGIRIAVEGHPDYPADQKIGEVLDRWRRKAN